MPKEHENTAFEGALLVGLGFSNDDGGFDGVSRFELARDFVAPLPFSPS